MSCHAQWTRPRARPRRCIELLEPRRLLAVVPQLVEVPISAAAIAADPSLNNYRCVDLQVTITTATDDWASADMKAVLSQGHFYTPGGGLDQDYPQAAFWSFFPNLEFDTFLCAPDFAAPHIPGSYSPLSNQPVITNTELNASWVDITHTSPGTYTIARLTISKDAIGSLIGRVGSNLAPNEPMYFGSTLPLPADQGTITGHLYYDPDNAARGSNALDGTVYLDTNDNGVLDPGEQSTQTIDSHGLFIFDNLPAGTYHVRQVPLGELSVTHPASGKYDVTLASDGRADLLNFGNYSPTAGLLWAIPFQDGNADGVQEAKEPSVGPGVQMFLDSNDNGQLDAGEPAELTNSSGVAAFAGISFGTYHVGEVVPPGYELVKPGTVTVNLNTRTTTSVPIGNIAIAPPPTELVGYVYEDRNQDSVREANEPGLRGVTVYVDLDHTHSLSAADVLTTTNKSGSYRIEGLPAGNWKVRQVVPSGYIRSRYIPVEWPVTLLVGGSAQAFFGDYRPLASAIGGSVVPVRTAFTLNSTVSVLPEPGGLIDDLFSQ